MKRIDLIIMALAPALWVGCQEEGRLDHINDNAPAPAQVTVTEVCNTPGGAVIRYKLPKDKNLLGVRAEYEIKPGVVHETKTSYYIDSVVLEGFSDTQTHSVKLFSVGKNGKESEPGTVLVNPKTAPIHRASKSLAETFGGVLITVDNPERANLAIVLMGDTARIPMGYQTTLQTFYTSAPKMSFRYRGLKDERADFSVYLRDRWSTNSDTTYATLKPLYEELIPKTTWQEMHLAGDCIPYTYLKLIWDDVADERNGYNQHFICNPEHCTYPTCPHWVTWDMGIKATISRLRFWFLYGHEYREGQIKKFELWGTDANPTASWDSWMPLGTFEIKPPTDGSNANLYARKGFDLDLEPSEFAPEPFRPVRYIRFKGTEVWDLGYQGMGIMEITFWGRVEQ